MTDLPPWERQPDEPALWFGRFDKYYRPMGTGRSLLGAYNAWGKAEKGRKGPRDSVQQAWRDAAVNWHWQQRAEAWDAEQRRLRLMQEQEAIEEMNRRQIRRSILLQDFGAGRLGYLQEQLKADPGKIETIGVGEARLYLKDGMAMERQAYGLPDAKHEVTGADGGDLVIRFTWDDGNDSNTA